jgi:hypothetical protein
VRLGLQLGFRVN